MAEQLSPAEQAQQALTDAIWAAHEEETRRHLESLREIRRIEDLRASGPKPAEHGTVGMYNNHKCRCTECRRAMREYSSARRRAAGAKEYKKATHGTLSKYNQGCRCASCKGAGRVYHRQKRRDAGIPERPKAARKALTKDTQSETMDA